MSAAGLDALAIEADGAGTAPDADQAPAGAAPTESPNYGAIGFALTAFRELTCKLLTVESPKRTLSDANIEACARVLAPVADKYGVNLGGMFSGPEGVAMMVAGPLLWEAATQLNLELKARRARPIDQAAPEPAPA